MRRKRRRGIGPVGTIVLIWVFFAFILPVLRLSGGLIAAGLAIMASVWAANALRRKAEKRKDEQASEAINELMSVSDKIIRDAIDDSADVPQIRKFLDFYLPTTIRLLNAYDRMSAQEFGGENITGSMQRIEEMLDTTIAAYKKQLDALFANQAADIQMDIDTMNTMLAREGLGGKGYLDIKDFMKQYEQQQSAAEAAPAPASDTSSEQTMKGSTSHG